MKTSNLVAEEKELPCLFDSQFNEYPPEKDDLKKKRLTAFRMISGNSANELKNTSDYNSVDKYTDNLGIEDGGFLHYLKQGRNRANTDHEDFDEKTKRQITKFNNFSNLCNFKLTKNYEESNMKETYYSNPPESLGKPLQGFNIELKNDQLHNNSEEYCKETFDDKNKDNNQDINVDMDKKIQKLYLIPKMSTTAEVDLELEQKYSNLLDNEEDISAEFKEIEDQIKNYGINCLEEISYNNDLEKQLVTPNYNYKLDSNQDENNKLSKHENENEKDAVLIKSKECDDFIQEMIMTRYRKNQSGDLSLESSTKEFSRSRFLSA